MKKHLKRRHFLKSLSVASALASIGVSLPGLQLQASPPNKNIGGSKLKLSLNAYSFNEPLRNGTMSIEDMLNFCAEHNFDAVDLTGYYLPGYPAVPPNEYIYEVKRKAFKLGLSISGTGIRNDFSTPEASKEKQTSRLLSNGLILQQSWVHL